MPSFTYQDECGMTRTLHWEDDEPDKFTIQTRDTFENLEEVNRAQGEFERATDRCCTVARVPRHFWEHAEMEGWDDARWAKFLNDPDYAHFRVWRGRL